MKYSSDLPLEERQRLDQMWANIAGGPNRNIYANENRGLNSMFPPKTSLIPPSQWINKTTGKPWEKSGRGDMPPGYKAGPTDAPIPWADDPRLAEFEHRPEMIRPAVIQPPSTTMPLPQPPVMPTPSPPTTMPVPQPPVMPTPQPPTTMPTPQPPKIGGGGNFLNRFERLLDGLEGLVGKLGADGSTPESPFSSGGGGLSDAIETPFTPTQDY